MAKFYGTIGYVEQVEVRRGVYEEQATERIYYGDILKDSRKWESTETLNDDLNVSNRISILADPYAFSHFHSMRYIELYGAKWKIRDVEVKYPRLILQIGGVYNGR